MDVMVCIDLSDNKITGLDRSIRYAPAIDTLVLDNNTIDSLGNNITNNVGK